MCDDVLQMMVKWIRGKEPCALLSQPSFVDAAGADHRVAGSGQPPAIWDYCGPAEENSETVHAGAHCERRDDIVTKYHDDPEFWSNWVLNQKLEGGKQGASDDLVQLLQICLVLLLVCLNFLNTKTFFQLILDSLRSFLRQRWKLQLEQGAQKGSDDPGSHGCSLGGSWLVCSNTFEWSSPCVSHGTR